MPSVPASGPDAAAFVRLFRSFCRSIRRLPSSSSREDAMSELRSSYTSRPSLPEDFAERRELYDAGCKRLALLRMKTGGTPSADSSKSGRILYVNGKRVEVNEHSATDPNISKEDKARYSNWHGGNLDPESVSRHQRLLNRAGFRNNSDAIGNGGIF